MLFGVIPLWLVAYANIFALLIVGAIAEEHYVSRLTIFTNGIAINVHLLTNLGGTLFAAGLIGIIIDAYALIGFVLAVTGLIFYGVNESLPQDYYDLGRLYGSVPTALFILVTGIIPVMF